MRWDSTAAFAVKFASLFDLAGNAALHFCRNASTPDALEFEPSPMSFTSLPAQLAGILVLSVGIAYWFGFGASRFLLPHEWLPYRWLLMPVVGLTLFAVIGQPLALLGVNSATLLWVLLPLALVVNVIAIVEPSRGCAILRIAKPSKVSKQPPLEPREIIAPLIVGFGAMVLALLPLFAYGYITVIGYNVDGSTYVAQAEFAKQFGLNSAQIRTIASPYAPTIANAIDAGIGMVGPLWQSLVSQLSARDSFYTFAPVTALWHGFGFLSVFVLYRAGFRLGFWASILALAALALNAVRLMIPMDNFAPHTFALALMPQEWLATYFYVQARSRRVLLLAALTLGAQILIYPEATPFYVLPFLVYLGFLAVQERTLPLHQIVSWIHIGVLSLVLAPTAYWMLYKSFVPQVGTVALAIGGTLNTFLSPAEGLGTSALRVDAITALPFDASLLAAWDVLAWVGVVVLVALGIAGLVAGIRSERWLLAAAAIAMLVFVAVMLLVQRYPYGFFKTWATGLFVFVALMGLGVQVWVERLRASPEARRWVAAPVAVTLFWLGLASGGAAGYQLILAQRDPVVTRRLIQLSNSDLLPPNASIYLSLTRVSNPRMYWAAYFLRAHPLFGNGIVAYSEINNTQDGVLYDYALLNREENPVEFDYAPDTAVWDDRWTILYRKQ